MPTTDSCPKEAQQEISKLYQEILFQTGTIHPLIEGYLSVYIAEKDITGSGRHKRFRSCSNLQSVK